MNKFLPILIAVLLSASSCNKEGGCDCLKSTGDDTSLEQSLPDFKTIRIYDLFQVYLTEDTVNKILLKGGENILPFISYEISNDTLVLKNDNRCNWVRSYKRKIYAYISIKSLKEVILNGESDVFSIGTLHSDTLFINVWAGIASGDLALDCEAFHLNLHASTGTYHLKGNVSFNYIYSVGNSYVYADSLKTSHAYITNRSTGDCYINANTWIDALIDGTGNVYYSGSAGTILLKQLGGTGNLIYVSPQ